MERKISVVINTYNAERHLNRVLEAVKDFDEVVVCDMESTDHTVDIAKEYGCRIVPFEKGNINIVEPVRNFAIQSAAYPWVLVVDADEIVTPGLRSYLYAHIRQTHPAEGIRIPRRNYFMGHFMHALYPDYILRFFQRDKTDWPPVIHVQPNVDGTVVNAPKKGGVWFEHLANDTISDRLRKTDVYTEYELKRKAGKKYRWWHMLTRPAHRFIKNYILKGGFRDGLPGFIYACLEATYQIVLIGKMNERSKPCS